MLTPYPAFPSPVQICASEQSVVVMDGVYAEVRKEFQRRGAFFLSEEQKVKARAKVGPRRARTLPCSPIPPASPRIHTLAHPTLLTPVQPADR